jgi:predicted aconitase with swiveling domain
MLEARTLVPGTGRGGVLVLTEPLSFWGGVDPATGDVIDVRHPQRGANVAGRVLVMTSGRGSSSSSSVLAEAVRAGSAPAAIVLAEPDPILALGAIVARELYGRALPVVVSPDPGIGTGDVVTVRAQPSVTEILPDGS